MTERDDPDPPLMAPAPPLLVYLPGMGTGSSNSARRVAEIMADEASLGPRTFAVERLDSSFGALGDGARIITEDGDLVLDVLEVDYRPRLAASAAQDDDTRGLVLQLVLALKYAVWAVQLLLGAGRRAKTGKAKAQIVLGFLSAGVLVLLFLVTLFAILGALDVVGEQDTSEAARGLPDEAIAIVLTAVTTWVFVTARPTIVRLGLLIERLMDLVHDDRQEAAVARQLAVAVDQVLDADPARPIYLLGYSLGSLVCLGFLFPRTSLHVARDPRHEAALRGLFTVGCPVDFVRLYLPDYLLHRSQRVTTLEWINITIDADVLASNFRDGQDASEPSGADDAGGPDAPMAMSPPISLRYTSEELTWRSIIGRRGFLSHTGYWDEVGNDSCLRLVLARIPVFGAVPDPALDDVAR